MNTQTLVQRNQIITPRNIIQQFNIESNMQVADFGSGAGDYAIAIAPLIQPQGKVFAIDIMESAHQSLRSKYKIQGITNIELILSNLERENGSTLPDQSIDIVMIHNILFQVQDKKHLIQEALRILKPEAKLIVIEWNISSPIGPIKSLRMPAREVISLVQNNGFLVDTQLQTGVYHYGYIFTKI